MFVLLVRHRPRRIFDIVLDALVRNAGRLSLRCASCGYEPPGWMIGNHPGDERTVPRVTATRGRIAAAAPRRVA
jgi:hypothetical protein